MLREGTLKTVTHPLEKIASKVFVSYEEFLRKERKYSRIYVFSKVQYFFMHREYFALILKIFFLIEDFLPFREYFKAETCD